MDEVKHLRFKPLRCMRSALFALVTLVLLFSAADDPEQSDLCSKQPDSCDPWTVTPHKRPSDTDTEVTYEQLKHMLSTGSVQLFDVREPAELEAGVIAGAANIPLGEMDRALRLTPHQFSERYGVPKPHIKDPDFVLYCQRGKRSLSALEAAWALGYTRARHYAGGYNEWVQREAQ